MHKTLGLLILKKRGRKKVGKNSYIKIKLLRIMIRTINYHILKQTLKKKNMKEIVPKIWGIFQAKLRQIPQIC